MGWKIIPDSKVKAHRGNHKIFTDYTKAKQFLDEHKDSYIFQSSYSPDEWKVYFPD